LDDSTARVAKVGLKVQGQWCYLYRVIDREGNLLDAMLSATRDMAAAHRFYRSAKAATGFVPDRVTTDGHGTYPRAIRTTLGKTARHRTNAYSNNRLEQDYRGIKGRIRCIRGFKNFDAAGRFCRENAELRDLPRVWAYHKQPVSAALCRHRLLRNATTALYITQTA
jgi:putative transposase